MPLCEFPDSFGRDRQAWDTYPQGARIQSATMIFKQEVAIIGHARSLPLLHGRRRAPH